VFLATVYPPSFTDNREYWDIGYLNPIKGKFIEVNAMSTHKVR
jgi:hypothetical protein